ncbi:MAG: hypothetical protein EOO54_23415 [Haliea sp.]|nr:MAG: hypothetical protein EOO54_23415 [Haliea sp.]
MSLRIGRYLGELAAFGGIRGCSLVEADSGLVVDSAGDFPDVKNLSEAAVEFWRVHARVKDNFTALGSLNLAMMAFQNGWLAVTACPSDTGLLLVAVARSQSVDWPGWLRHARGFEPFGSRRLPGPGPGASVANASHASRVAP